ncbi:MAG: HD domain-containing protein, partial [Ruminococcus sp.]|nr:HD domain-containing protein [Ruminococcus sp.]
IKALIEPNAMYYSLLNMLMAVMCVHLVQKGIINKYSRVLLRVPVFALVISVLDAVITWFMNNQDIGGVAQPLVKQINRSFCSNKFLAQFMGDLIVELADKFVTLTILYFVYKYLSSSLKEKFVYNGKWQAELSKEMAEAMSNNKSRSASLKTKILFILLTASVFIAVFATLTSYILFKQSNISEHTKTATGIAKLVSSRIDAEKVDGFIEKGEEAQGYTETEQLLYDIRNSNDDVEFVYVYRILDDGCHVVFDLDTDELAGAEPGDVIPFDDAFKPYIPDLLAGREIDPIITDETYGYLLTSYVPVYDQNGKCQCYAAVDFSMKLLNTYGYSFMAKLVSLILSFFVLVIAVGLWIIEHNVIIPVRTMAYCAEDFSYNTEQARDASVDRLIELKIRTGDEVEALYRSFLKTTQESMQYVEDIQQKTETISNMSNGLIMVLADLVESRDKCTGDHVRKTAAYVKIILDQMKKMGMHSDVLTEQFMNDVEHAAPLHDIGKIHVSDVILNKPGRLTDEEFEIMKSHTYLGSAIIDRAIEMVPESGYLHEAKNLSEYHHEKWNGKGYPNGISGEDIPLSARIMAVADVFDALVSRRSYKEPFTIEKALEIIKIDAGTHFDPDVVEAFLAAEAEVRVVAAQFEDK